MMIYATPENEEEQWDFVSMFECMVLGYNILINLSAIPINIVVIVKEASMPFIQFLNPDAGHDDDDISLTTDVQLRAIDWINPLNWVNMFWYTFFGFDVRDYFRYNPANDSAYYKNWFHLGGV
jgi:hypothetical protein